MMTNMVQEYVMETAWQRKRRIRRMMQWDKQSRTGIVQPDRTWQVILLFAVCMLFVAFTVARWWVCGC